MGLLFVNPRSLPSGALTPAKVLDPSPIFRYERQAALKECGNECKKSIAYQV